jgi:hypothetical protein
MSSYDTLLAAFYIGGKATYIEAVELGDAILCNQLRNARIALRHPSEELGDTHGGCWSLEIA